MSARGITLDELRTIDKPNEIARRAIAELEAEHERGCRCDVALVSVRQLGPREGAIVELVHELWCPRWVASTS